MSRYTKRKWLFTKQEVEQSPSIVAGFTVKKEKLWRRQQAHFIFEVGEELKLSRKITMTAIIFMHRYYMYERFVKNERYNLSLAAIHLSLQLHNIQETPIRLYNACYKCIYSIKNKLDVYTPIYINDLNLLIFKETLDRNKRYLYNVLDRDVCLISIDIYLREDNLIYRDNSRIFNNKKEFSDITSFVSMKMLLDSTLCLEYPPSYLACMIIYMAIAWLDLEVLNSQQDDRSWYNIIDDKIEIEEIENAVSANITFFKRCSKQAKLFVIYNFFTPTTESSNSPTCSNSPSSSKWSTISSSTKSSTSYKSCTSKGEEELAEESDASSTSSDISMSSWGSGGTPELVSSFSDDVSSTIKSKREVCDRPPQTITYQFPGCRFQPENTIMEFCLEKFQLLNKCPELSSDKCLTSDSESDPLTKIENEIKRMHVRKLETYQESLLSKLKLLQWDVKIIKNKIKLLNRRLDFFSSQQISTDTSSHSVTSRLREELLSLSEEAFNLRRIYTSSNDSSGGSELTPKPQTSSNDDEISTFESNIDLLSDEALCARAQTITYEFASDRYQLYTIRETESNLELPCSDDEIIMKPDCNIEELCARETESNVELATNSSDEDEFHSKGDIA